MLWLYITAQTHARIHTYTHTHTHTHTRTNTHTYTHYTSQFQNGAGNANVRPRQHLVHLLHQSSKTSRHYFFLIFRDKLACYKFRKVTKPDFPPKIYYFNFVISSLETDPAVSLFSVRSEVSAFLAYLVSLFVCLFVSFFLSLLHCFLMCWSTS